MPHLDVNGTTLYYEDTGGGPETILFSHGLLMSTALFEPQIAHFRDRYRCVAYDHRGQGRSAVPAERSIDMDTVYVDAVALIERLGLGAVHFAGLSMGGFVGLRLAARRPDLVRSLILMETSADAEEPANVSRYRLLNFVARWFGIFLVVDRVMPIMFGRTFLADPGRAAERAAWRQRLAGNRRTIWRAVNGVVERRSVHEELGRITAPTLIIVGEEDVATVPAKAERLHAAIRGSSLVHIPRAGHSSAVEEPAAVNAAIAGFLAAQGAQAG